MGNRQITITDELYVRLQARAIPLEDTIETVIAKMCDQLDGMMVAEGSHAHMIGKAARMLGYDGPAALFARMNEQEANANRAIARMGEQEAAAQRAVAKMGEQESAVGRALARMAEQDTSAKRAVAQLTEQEAAVKRAIAQASGQEEALRHAKAAELGSAYAQAIKSIEEQYGNLTIEHVVPKTFRTSRRIYLPVGAELVGEYQGQKVSARVQIEGIEFHGEFFDNPSSAAVAAKKSLGASEKAAQTNGWTFWQIEMHPGIGMYQPLQVLRERQQGDQTERPGGDES